MADTSLYVRRLDGFDGSHWQPDAGPMDLAKTREAMTWLAWKVSQSTKGIDPTFPDVARQAEALRFRWFLGYHWLSSTTDPAAQADHFLANNTAAGSMLDAEEAGITVAKCLTWLRRVESTTRRPCSVYTGLYVAGGTIWRSPEIRNSIYGPRPMHLAAYITVSSLIGRLSSLGVLDLVIDAWQWSSNGPVPGITGRADMNTIVTPQMMDLVCGITAQPQPSEDEMTIVLTNSQPGKYGNERESKWERMPGGTKKALTFPDWSEALGSPDGRPCSDATLDALPDWVAAAGGTVDDVARQVGAALQAELHEVKGALKAAGE